MTVPPRETGSALLTVLLLVAVMATIAATALDRLSVGTRLAANVATVGQARAWLGSAELLAVTRIEDMLGADQAQTLASGWLGAERTISLPDGATVKARVEDGGNCFNLNSLVEQPSGGGLAARPVAQRQFTALMQLLGIGEGEASQIAASATDYIDSDSAPLPGGAEDGPAGALSANRKMADPSELRAVPGVSDRHYKLLKPWICALPIAELSPINVNTLLPEQAPLLAMLVPGRLDTAGARALIATRPADGYGSVVAFWQQPPLASIEAPSEVTQQTKVRTSFFKLRARVDAATVSAGETALIDARRTPAQIVRRSFGEEG
ncbi:MAG: type II secretion system minor pseudopilin GspK [Sphingomonas sp.]|nr:type II secretion system minor pseudopilin GspK [Sphingomonas sp.]